MREWALHAPGGSHLPIVAPKQWLHVCERAPQSDVASEGLNLSRLYPHKSEGSTQARSQQEFKLGLQSCAGADELPCSRADLLGGQSTMQVEWEKRCGSMLQRQCPIDILGEMRTELALLDFFTSMRCHAFSGGLDDGLELARCGDARMEQLEH